jgi:hypothetical protein
MTLRELDALLTRIDTTITAATRPTTVGTAGGIIGPHVDNRLYPCVKCQRPDTCRIEQPHCRYCTTGTRPATELLMAATHISMNPAAFDIARSELIAAVANTINRPAVGGVATSELLGADEPRASGWLERVLGRIFG